MESLTVQASRDHIHSEILSQNTFLKRISSRKGRGKAQKVPGFPLPKCLASIQVKCLDL